MSLSYKIMLTLGIFFGNFLVVPLFSRRTFYEGFWIGVIAAFLAGSILFLLPD
jgi:hypothetical protein